jgi:histone H3/H4
MADTLIIESRFKEFVKAKGGADIRVAGDAAEAVSKIVEKIVEDGIERAKANGRKTVQAQDF